MQYLETFLQKQAQIVATSFILGLIFGASYDIIRINHILCSIVSYDGGKRKTKRGVVPFLILFFTDLTENDIIIQLTVGCKNIDHYNSILSRLRAIPHVENIERGIS